MVLYYACIAGCFAPWLLMTAGAVRKTFSRPGHRLYRLQAEGVVILLCGMAAAWVLFDRYFGVDPERSSLLAYWFIHGERGLFWIGQLLLFMAYFLERRPGPGIVPWPPAARTVAMAGIVLGLAWAAAATVLTRSTQMTLPWSWAREGWSLGLIPFSVGYAREAWRTNLRPGSPDLTDRNVA